MVDRIDPDPLTAILKAVSDPSRRKILTILVQEGPMRVGELAGRFAMSLNAVSKHIKALEEAGLVERRTEWRDHIISANLEPAQAIDAWFAQLRSSWDMRLDRLSDLMSKETTDDD